MHGGPGLDNQCGCLLAWSGCGGYPSSKEAAALANRLDIVSKICAIPTMFLGAVPPRKEIIASTNDRSYVAPR